MATSYLYAPLAPNTPVLYKPHPRSKPIPARVRVCTECGRYLVIEVDLCFGIRETRVDRNQIEPYDPNDPSQTENLACTESQSIALNAS